MNKREFSEELSRALNGLPEEDVAERVAFYGEMIDDRVEEGMSEEEAVAGIGPVDGIASQIIAETPIGKIVRERIRPKRSVKTWETVLIILGFPVWFALIVAAFAVVFSLYVALWSLVISLWAVEISLWAGAAGSAGMAAYYIYCGDPVSAALLFGVGLVCAGLSVFLFPGCLAASKGTARLAKRIVRGIKKALAKENSK
ncbi:MAG: DUF1700 domain-containing protein [Clostridia bacterium]|nr:DUF1700 domain-containing protein [Clostridia bacterium]MBP5269678.1 DUF1700 domain-containing protein [Clostridia bacterium]